MCIEDYQSVSASIQPVLKVSFNKDKISIFDDHVLALAVEKVGTIPFLFKMMFSSYYILMQEDSVVYNNSLYSNLILIT